MGFKVHERFEDYLADQRQLGKYHAGLLNAWSLFWRGHDKMVSYPSDESLVGWGDVIGRRILKGRFIIRDESGAVIEVAARKVRSF